MKELTISAIKDGTVIDHIPAGCVFKIGNILRIDEIRSRVSIAANLPSTEMGKKGIIKISGVELAEEDVQKIALLAPDATLNIIKDYKVRSKEKLTVPGRLIGILRCFNPSCITNAEPVVTQFTVDSKDPLILRCHHCERCARADDIELI